MWRSWACRRCPLLSDFGIIVAINITVALLSALIVLPPILVWADQRNWVSRGLIKKPPPHYETVDERYPELVGSNGSVDGRVAPNGNVGNGRPAPPAPQPQPQPQPRPQPQPVSPGVHVPPAPAPADLWLPQFRNP